MTTSHTVHRDIELSCIQGVSVELRHVLPKGWTVAKESDSFVVRGALDETCEDDVWRVVRFVTYRSFLTLRQTRRTADEVRYEMISATDSGSGFRMEFILAKQI